MLYIPGPAEAVNLVSQAKPSQIDRVQQAQGQPSLWRPDDTPGPAQPLAPAQALHNGIPTLDLLITVRLLRQEVMRGSLQLDANTIAALVPLLRQLQIEQSWSPAQARTTQQAILDALLPTEVAALERQRAALERSAQSIMTRARFATPDGPLNLNLIRYGLMVPGGQDTVKLVSAQPRQNPYLWAGANATLLKQLLDFLGY